MDDARRVVEAFDAVTADLERLAARLHADGHPEPAAIADATAMIAADPDLREAALDGTGSGLSGVDAVGAAVERYAQLLAALPDPVLAGRAADVRAVGRRLLARLGERGPAGPDPLVLAGAEVAVGDLLPAGTRVAAVVSVRGGPAGHTAIVARSLGVPVVFGVPESLLDVPDGVEVAVDGGAGTAIVAPTGEQRGATLAALGTATGRRRALAAHRAQPPVTRDGQPVALLANVATAADTAAAVSAGAAGAGLVRTEVPFLSAPAWPSLDEHLAALQPVLTGWSGRTVTVRTLDFAGDKLPPFLRATGGPVPEGPLRPGRMLAEPEAFTAQLRAILRAAARARVLLRVLLPAVSTVEELAGCRELLSGAARAEGVTPPPLGAMVELPEAVRRAEELAGMADFFSIGTNDLSAALLGLSRTDARLSPGSAAEPVVLRAIGTTVAAGIRHGRDVSVCGDAAAEPAVLPLIVGLGVRTVSVSPAAVDEVRAVIRGLDARACAETTRSIMTG